MFYSPEKCPDTRWIRGLVGDKAGLDDTKQKYPLLLPGIKPRFLGGSVRIVAAIPTELISASNAKSAFLCPHFHLLLKGTDILWKPKRVQKT